jgi:hypothetical protein
VEQLGGTGSGDCGGASRQHLAGGIRIDSFIEVTSGTVLLWRMALTLFCRFNGDNTALQDFYVFSRFKRKSRSRLKKMTDFLGQVRN